MKSTSLLKRRLMSFIGSTVCFASCIYANPEGGSVDAGNAIITQEPNNTQIIQSSEKAIINWNSFNINAGERTHFQQPTGGITLNRINPNQGASQIFGQLSSTGKIILVNQAGVFFGSGAQVNVGGIIASTSNISDQNFLSGKLIFDQKSAYGGSIINQGTINAADHGLVALIGTGVVNNGIINARLGTVVLGSGDKFTVDLYGDQLINFSIDEAAGSAGIDQNGNALKDGVHNSGSVFADGGRILMTGKVASGVVDNVINMDGVAQAKSVAQINGTIILGGHEGKVQVTGKIIASGNRGGKVKILGKNIKIASSATVDASGETGGGEILVGGNYQGKGIEQNAETTTIEKGALLNADALQSGNGGRIIVWANGETDFAGNISAQGGTSGGDGGFAEVSGHHLAFKGEVNLSAPKGLTGNLLLDPENITIQSAGATNASGTGTPINTYTSNVDSSILKVSDLLTALTNSNVLVQTGAGGSEAGDIAINDNIQWTSGNTLTLSAYRHIILNNNIQISNTGTGSLNLQADNTGIGTGGITLKTGSLISLSTGNLSIYANTMNFSGGTNSIQGSGNIQLGGSTVNTTIGLNNTGGTLEINATNLAALKTGFNQLIIGKTGQTGNISVSTTTLSLPTTFQTTGQINLSGNVTGPVNRSITFNGPIFLSNSLGIISDGGTINFNSTIDGNQQLQLTASTITANGVIGGITPLSQLLVNHALSVTLKGVNTTSYQTYETNQISLAGIYSASTFEAYGYSSSTVQGTLAGNTTMNLGSLVYSLNNGTLDGSYNFSVNATSGISIRSNIGTTTSLTNLSLTAPSILLLPNNSDLTINTTGNQTYTGSVSTLGVSNNVNFNGASINFNGDLNTGNSPKLNFNNSADSSITGILTAGGIHYEYSFYYYINYPQVGSRLIRPALNKLGAGNLTLSGNNSTTLTGATLIEGGSLTLTNENQLGNNQPLYIDNNSILKIASNFSLGADKPLFITSGTFQVDAGTLVINGQLSKDSNLNSISVTKTGAGNLEFSSNSEFFNLNDMYVNQGTITLNKNAGSGTTYHLTNNASLSLNGNYALNASVDLGSAVNTITVTPGSNVSISGLSGSGNFIKAGSGTLALGNGSYSGETYINSGTLSILGVDSLGTTTSINVASGATLDISFQNIWNGTLNNSNTINVLGIGVGGNGALTFNGAAATLNNSINLTGNTTFGGSQSGTLQGILNGSTNSITKVGVGTLYLNASNNYSGTTTVNGGVLGIIDSSSLGTNNIINLNGGLLVTGTSAILNQTINLTGNSSIGVYNTAQLNGAISGDYNLEKSYGGTLILTGNNNINGAITVSGGTLSISDRVNLGNDNTITLYGSGNANIGALLMTGINAVLNNNIVLANNSSIGVTNTATLNGIISGNYGLNATGAGTLILAGSNTYTGSTNINNDSTLKVANASGLGVNNSGVNISPGGVLNIAFSNDTLTNTGDINLNEGSGKGSGAIYFSGTNAVLNNNIALNNYDYYDPSVAVGFGASGSGILNGSIYKWSNIKLYGSGSIELKGNNSFLGHITTYGGTLVVNNQNNLGISWSELNLNGTLKINGNTTLTTPITLSTSVTFFTDANAALSGNIGGNGTFTKAGSGILTLNRGNSFSGNVTVNDGTLSIDNSSMINNNPLRLNGTGTNNIGALQVTGITSFTNTVSLMTNTTIGVSNAATFNNAISGTYNLTKTGSGKLILAGNNSYSGSTNVNQGSLSVTNVSGLGNTSGISVVSGAELDFSFNGTLNNTNAILLQGNGITGTGVLTFNGSNATLNNTITVNNDFTINGSGNGILNGAISANTFNLTKSGAGTLTLSNSNIYNKTIINGGTLSVSDSSNLGSSSSIDLNATLALTGTNATFSPNIILTNNGTINTSGSVTLNGIISGNYNLIKTGGGSLTLASANTYSGTTTVSGGTLSLSNTQSFGGSMTMTTVQNNATLDLAFDGTLGNTNNIFIGGVGVGGNGALTVSSNNAILNNNISLTSATTLGGAGTGSLGGIISGAYNLTKVDVGKISLANANTFSGTTTVSGGTLSLNNSLGLGNTTGVTVQSNSTLDLAFNSATLGNSGLLYLTGSGFNNNAALSISGSNVIVTNNINSNNATLGGAGSGQMTGVISGDSLTKNGTGTLEFLANNTYTNGITINAGTIIASNTNALGSGRAWINSGGTLKINNLNLSMPLYIGGEGVNAAGAVVGIGNASASGQVTLIGANNIVSAPTNNDTLTFSYRVEPYSYSENALTTAGAGNLRFLNVVGALSITTSSQGTTYFNTPVIITNGSQTYNNPTTFANGSTLYVGLDRNLQNSLTINSNVTAGSFSTSSYVPVVINGSVSANSWSVLGSEIRGEGVLNIGSLSMSTLSSGINLSNTSNQIGSMNVYSGIGDIFINNNRSLVINYLFASDTQNSITGVGSVFYNVVINNTAGTTPSSIRVQNTIEGNNITLLGLNIMQDSGAIISSPTHRTITIDSGTGTYTTNDNSTLATTGIINLIGDRIALHNLSYLGGTVDNDDRRIGVASEINISPKTNNTTVALGSDTGGTLAFSTAELNTLHANTIRIGAPTTTLGLITLSAFTPSNNFASTALILQNFINGITQTTGPFNLNSNSTLVIKGSGDVTLNNIDPSVAVNLSSGSFSLTDPSGTPVVVTSYNDPVAGLVEGITAPGGVTLRASGALILNKPIQTSGASDIILSASHFVNNVGANALSLGTGHYQVWSTNLDPFNSNSVVGDFRNNLGYNYKQYNATYGLTTVQGTGNGFLYSLAPSITTAASGGANKVYDGTNTASLSGIYLNTSGGTIGNDVVNLSATSASFDNKNVGQNKSVTVDGISVVSANEGSAAVYGYTVAPTATASIGNITPAALTILNLSVNDKYFNNTSAATLNFDHAILSGMISGDTINFEPFNYTSYFTSTAVGDNIPVVLSELGINGVMRNNYILQLPQNLRANILGLPESNTVSSLPEMNTAAVIQSATEFNTPLPYNEMVSIDIKESNESCVCLISNSVNIPRIGYISRDNINKASPCESFNSIKKTKPVLLTGVLS